MDENYQTALTPIRDAAENFSHTAINRLLNTSKPCGLTDASRILHFNKLI